MTKKEIDDRFKKFGTVSFTAISKVNDFIGYLEEGKIMATQCKKCGMVFFPPRADCCSCLSSDMEWKEVAGEGNLLTFSKLQYGPVGFENDLPYTIGVAQFREAKVFGRISKEIPDDMINIGMRVKVVPVQLPNGNIAYEFQKA
ncbi:MAG: Zn-ribbon domain-containing OB-fold protein [Desulfobacterota bacterium]|nr:Zn-ribbon domain-containing OB-fold protein [Thermodesulfobacteriota bacterium]